MLKNIIFKTRVLNLILVILISTYTSGQSSFEELKSIISGIRSINEVKDLISSNLDSINIVTSYEDISRDIDFNYFHQRFVFTPWEGYPINIDLIKRNDSLVYINLSEYDYEKDKHIRNSEIERDPHFISNYIVEHNKFYNTKLSVLDFRKQLRSNEMLGFNCGMAATETTPLVNKMNKLIKSRRKHELRKYLRSFSPEYQFVGALGLIKLGKVSSTDQILIDHLKKRNSALLSCSGCLIHYDSRFLDLLK